MPLWTPSRITTALWLDAADSSTLFDATSGGSLVAADGAIARWQDKSGNTRHATQETSGSRPIRKTSILNAKDVARFNGSSSVMRCDALATVFNGDDTAFSTLSVISSTNTASFKSWFCVGRSADQLYFANLGQNTSEQLDMTRRSSDIGANTKTASGTTVFTAASVVSTVFSGTATSAWISGSLEINSVDQNVATMGSNLNQAAVGAVARNTTASYWPGDIMELIILPSQISTSDRQTLEGYAAHKWGLTASLPNDHPYKNTAPSYGGSSPINGQSLIRPAGSAQQQLLIQGATT
jgi:hypothetical protein